MAKEPVLERRKYPRVKTEVLAAIEREDSSNVVAYAVDLSLGGIRFRYLGSGREFQLEELVRMTLRVGDADASVTGKVTRIQQLDATAHELALSFVDLDAHTRGILGEHLWEAEEIGS